MAETTKRAKDFENELQAAATALLAGVKSDLDMAAKNLTAEDYESELLRIAWVSRSSTSGPSHSTTNLAEGIWRQEALDRLHRFGINGL